MKAQSRSFRNTLVAVLIATGFIAGQHARANTLFTLDDVQDANGGVYTGSFDFNSMTDAISDVAISVAASGLPDSSITFSGTTSDRFCIDCNPTSQYDEFRLYAAGSTSGTSYSLYFDVANPLNLDGSNPLIPDLEHLNNYSDLDFLAPGGSLQSVGIVQGSLDAATVPEPATLALLAAGLLCLAGFAASNRSRKAAKVC